MFLFGKDDSFHWLRHVPNCRLTKLSPIPPIRLLLQNPPEEQYQINEKRELFEVTPLPHYHITEKLARRWKIKKEINSASADVVEPDAIRRMSVTKFLLGFFFALNKKEKRKKKKRMKKWKNPKK